MPDVSSRSSALPSEPSPQASAPGIQIRGSRRAADGKAICTWQGGGDQATFCTRQAPLDAPCRAPRVPTCC
ncbi:hypothetical protein E2C01_056895 [Portunus trituberculatus]|uniref:Uncharacterized protein n=1 Tax=Portunus trituberculatus TaxID=210409 RepID=A0A5B7GZG4_PORTR|nr:hypothetical protein [Portunus trituberculatus]